jgi:hemerythrin-like metal-binding protein
MKEVKWTDDLSVGVDLIDAQHKMLIQHLNNLTQSLASHEGPGKITTTLSFLIEYTHFHFSAEEKHMAANNYPGLDAHKIQHEAFKQTLDNLEDDFKEEGPTHMLAQDIDTLLVNWLLKHIQGIDVEFGTFLKRNGITISEES